MSDKELKQLLEELQKELKHLLKDKLNRIILYGSYANKTFDEESDVDIMVLTELTDDEVKKIHDDVIDIVVDLSLKYDVLVSVVLKSSKQFNKYSSVIPFYKNVLEYGVTLYE